MRSTVIPSVSLALGLLSATPGWTQPVRVSVSESGAELAAPSTGASADATGRFVVFTTDGSAADLYLRDVQAGTTTSLFVGPNGTRADAAVTRAIISGDGQHIVFESAATNIVSGVPATCPQSSLPTPCTNVYALHRPTGVVTLLSRALSGSGSNGMSTDAAVSHDGRMVVFESRGSDLVAGDTNARPDVFVFDRQTSQVRRVSVTSAGVEATFEPQWEFYPGPPSISANGRYVTFGSGATNLFPGDTIRSCVVDLVGLVNCADVFVHDLQTGTTELVSVDSSGRPGDRGARYGVTSDDGRYVALVSNSGNFGMGPATQRFSHPRLGAVFLRDRLRGTTTPLSSADVNVSAIRTWHLSISRDGRVVGFGSDTRLLPGLTFPPSGLANFTYVWELGTGLRLLATPGGDPIESSLGAITGGGRWFVVTSPSTMVVPGDTNGVQDVFLVSADDADGDTLPDAWETAFGLNPYGTSGRDGTQGDPDGDGLTNAREFASQTHPTGLASATRFFAEGATSSFFETRIAVANPGAQLARVLLRLDRTDGAGPARSTTVLVPPGQSRKVVVSGVDGMSNAEFATVLESDQPVVAERLMWWSSGEAYGTHGERALEAPSATWYFAEGATTGGFNVFYLLQNPGETPAEVRVRYLRSQGAPIEKTYTLHARSRTNIWANVEEIAGQRPLASAEFSAEIRVVSGPPIIAERAMYLDGGAGSRLFEAGHAAAGVTAAATEWFFAEGATGTYFDTFLLLANATTAPAEVQAEYLLQDGTTVTRAYIVPAASRYTIWVDQDDPRLADVAASVRLRALNGTPFVAERAMWWPGPTPATWREAHASTGSTASAVRWVMADGVVQDAPAITDTYVLIANVTMQDARVRVTLLYDDGGAAQSKEYDVAASSRFNVDVRAEFPQAAGRGFGAIVESVDGRALVVERSLYNDAQGVHWAAGTSALATPVP